MPGGCPACLPRTVEARRFLVQEVAEAALRAVEVRAPHVERTEVMTQQTSEVSANQRIAQPGRSFFYFTGMAYWNAWDNA